MGRGEELSLDTRSDVLELGGGGTAGEGSGGMGVVVLLLLTVGVDWGCGMARPMSVNQSWWVEQCLQC